MLAATIASLWGHAPTQFSLGPEAQPSLNVLTAEQAGDGVCLDGSPPAYLYQPASAKSNRAETWVLFLVGGGWCMDEQACEVRSKQNLGSSAYLAVDETPFTGILSDDADINPGFHDAHRVFLHYCDGGSFSGHVSSPIKTGNSTIYHRGREVLASLVRALVTTHGLGDAKHVLLSGESAGGLASLMQADAVSAMLPDAQTVKVVCAAGWFLPIPTGGHHDANSPWLNSVRASFDMHGYANAPGVSACIAQKPEGDSRLCWYPHHLVGTIRTPVFLVHSAFDSWQLSNVWRSDEACVFSKFDNCTAAETASVNGFGQKLIASISQVLLSRPGNGAYITPCLRHDVLRPHDGFDALPEGRAMLDAIRVWWDASSSTSASEHTRLPCNVTLDAPAACNVECGERAVPTTQLEALTASLGSACESTTTCSANIS